MDKQECFIVYAIALAVELVLVEVTTERTFGVGQQRVLFSVAEYVRDFNHVLYDLTPDDQRFVMHRRTEADIEEERHLASRPPAPHLVATQNSRVSL